MIGDDDKTPPRGLAVPERYRTVQPPGPRLQMSTTLAGSVRYEYEFNHHWIRLTDENHREILLIEQAVVLYTCIGQGGCREQMLLPFNRGPDLLCPHCGRRAMIPVWTRPQIALVAERESDFVMPRR